MATRLFSNVGKPRPDRKAPVGHPHHLHPSGRPAPHDPLSPARAVCLNGSEADTIPHRIAFGRVATSYFENLQMPSALPILGAAVVLVGAAVLASLMPAARASRVDVLQALRSE